MKSSGSELDDNIIDCSVPDSVIEFLRASAPSETDNQDQPQSQFEKGEKLEILDGPFAGLEGIYQLSKGDMIFLFSDGFPDQFGGAKERKIGYQRFRGMLFSNWELPLEEQNKELIKFYETWVAASKCDQTDDICIVGLKL